MTHPFIEKSLSGFAGAFRLSHGGVAFRLQSCLRCEEDDETTNDEDEEKSEPRDVKIALRPEELHVMLHVGQGTAVGRGVLGGRVMMLRSEGVDEEEEEHGHGGCRER